MYRVRAHEIPVKARTAKGVLVQGVLPLEPEERIEALVDTRDYESFKYMVMITKKGPSQEDRLPGVRQPLREAGCYQPHAGRRGGSCARDRRQ